MKGLHLASFQKKKQILKLRNGLSELVVSTNLCTATKTTQLNPSTLPLPLLPQENSEKQW